VNDKLLALLDKQLSYYQDQMETFSPGEEEYDFASMQVDKLISALTATANGEQLLEELLRQAPAPKEIM
jgi:hypothetical protein